jgi:hypothetical protein
MFPLMFRQLGKHHNDKTGFQGEGAGFQRRRNSVKLTSWNRRLEEGAMRGGTGFLAGMAAGLALVVSPALAESAAETRAAATTAPPRPAPLQPGKSAGIHAAQQAHTGLALIGAGAIIAIVVVAAGAGGNGSGAQPNAQNAPVTTAP